MKRNLYLLFALLLTGAVQVKAQGFVITVKDKSGAATELWSSSSVSACKLTFADGQMKFHEGDAVKSTFKIKDIAGMGFYTSQGVESAVAAAGVSYAAATEQLVVNAASGTVVAIYSADGKKAYSHMVTISANVISVAHLPAGMYVAVAGGETLKFMK